MDSGGLNSTEIHNILNSPASEPPDGILPNFDNPRNRNGITIITTTILGALVAVFFSIRIYTRVYCVKRFRFEDYIGLVALPFFIAGTWMLCKSAQEIGMFVKMWDIRMKDFDKLSRTYIRVTTMYCVVLMLTKVSILLEWANLLVPRHTHNTFFWFCYGLIGINCCLYVVTIIISNYAYNAPEKTWRPYLPGTCLDICTLNIVFTVLHLIFDLIMFLLPHTIIWRLSLATRQRIVLSTVFSVGILNCLCAAGRVVSAVILKQKARTDLTGAYSSYLMWDLGETATAILIFCVPAIPIAFRGTSPVSRFSALLGSKLGIFSAPRNISSASQQGHLGPETTNREHPSDGFPWADESSEVYLTELEPARTRSRDPKVQVGEPSMHYDRGILRITEIDIRTSENPDMISSRGIQQQTHQPAWLDCESD